MIPVPPANEMSNGGRSEPELGSEILAAFPCGAAADNFNRLFVSDLGDDFSITERHQAEPHGMGSVLTSSGEFEVIDVVVGLHAVDVVDVKSFWDRPNEGNVNKPVGQAAADFPAKPQRVGQVASSALGPEQFATQCMAFPIAPYGDVARGSRLASGRYFVDTIALGNGAPALCGRIVGSHASLLARGSVVRAGVSVDALPRPVLIISQKEQNV